MPLAHGACVLSLVRVYLNELQQAILTRRTFFEFEPSSSCDAAEDTNWSSVLGPSSGELFLAAVSVVAVGSLKI
jgi:hypothetical protein